LHGWKSRNRGKGNGMAEFVKVATEMARMCRHYEGFCKECPLGHAVSCHNWMLSHPKEAEEIIMKWAAENQPKTNGNKFEEIFGYPFCVVSCGSISAISQWLKSEYREPEEREKGEKE